LQVAEPIVLFFLSSLCYPTSLGSAPAIWAR
jgi:hypothetical protein